MDLVKAGEKLLSEKSNLLSEVMKHAIRGLEVIRDKVFIGLHICPLLGRVIKSRSNC